MYAIVEIGNSQFKVSEGDTIAADRLAEKEGKTIKLDKVLLFSKGNDVRIGQPYLNDVKVEASILRHVADRKVLAFKHRKRKNSTRTVGQRHRYTTLNITKITA
jgi:large subunit ribosomal protein L21